MRDITFLEQRIPFGNDLIYEVTNMPGLALSGA